MMQNREIKFKKEARDLIIKGVELTAAPVAVTLGAKGKNVIIQNTPTDSDHGTRITKDGVSVARSIDFDDPYLRIGANLVKQVAQSTCDVTGDGTTTATILVREMIKNGIRLLEAGVPPVSIRKGMQKAFESISEKMTNQAKPCNSFEEIKAVASISANNDAELGEVVAKVMHKIGPEGIVEIQDSDDHTTSIEQTDGMRIDSGFASPYFINNMADLSCELNNVMILITNMKVNSMEALMNTMEIARRNNKSLLVIGTEYQADALPGLISNHRKGNLSSCAIKAPSVGVNRMEMLEDLATLTAGEVLTEQKGMGAEHVDEGTLGECKKVIITKTSTTIIGGIGDEKAINERKKAIKASIKNLKGKEKDMAKDRLARLESGVAVIKVGAFSETELSEKKDRLEDSIGATTAAMEEGIVSGGGMALALAARNLTIEGDENIQAGVKVVQKACQVPLRTIAINSDQDDGWVYNKAMESGLGFNALTDTFEDLIRANVIDPVKVPRIALEKAVSIASMFLSTDAVIVDKL